MSVSEGQQREPIFCRFEKFLDISRGTLNKGHIKHAGIPGYSNPRSIRVLVNPKTRAFQVKPESVTDFSRPGTRISIMRGTPLVYIITRSFVRFAEIFAVSQLCNLLMSYKYHTSDNSCFNKQNVVSTNDAGGGESVGIVLTIGYCDCLIFGISPDY